MVFRGTGATTGANEPLWREKRTAFKVSFGSPPIKKLHAADYLKKIEVAVIHWAMKDYFIVYGTHDPFNKVFFMIAE